MSERLLEFAQEALTPLHEQTGARPRARTHTHTHTHAPSHTLVGGDAAGGEDAAVLDAATLELCDIVDEGCATAVRTSLDVISRAFHVYRGLPPAPPHTHTHTHSHPHPHEHGHAHECAHHGVAGGEPHVHTAHAAATSDVSDTGDASPAWHEVAFSFNGGKDSTLVLHLLRAAIAMGRIPGLTCICQCVCVYFHCDGEFEYVHDFMREMQTRYGFKLRMLPGFKEGMAMLQREGVRAILMGTRRCDPDGRDAEAFMPCSLDWPSMMRIYPVLHWSYRHVWTFLRGARLPYCRLYDQGYTSLGSVADSRPNPQLRVRGSVAEAEDRYLPAYMLTDPTLERAGRVERKRKTPVATSLPTSTEAQSATRTAAVMILPDDAGVTPSSTAAADAAAFGHNVAASIEGRGGWSVTSVSTLLRWAGPSAAAEVAGIARHATLTVLVVPNVAAILPEMEVALGSPPTCAGDGVDAVIWHVDRDAQPTGMASPQQLAQSSVVLVRADCPELPATLWASLAL